MPGAPFANRARHCFAAKLTPARRASLVFDIHLSAASVSLGVVWPAEIDDLNIHRATLLAMRRAVHSLQSPPGIILVDGVFTPGTGIPERAVRSGDGRSVSIAAASIIAKTARDRMMDAYDRIWPGYGFSSNKGYPTAAHRAYLAERGPCPIHRISFNGVAAQGQAAGTGDGGRG